MKNFFYCLLIFYNAVIAQDTTSSTVNAATHDSSTSVTIPAQFPGGEQAWNNYIYGRLRSDVVAQNNALEGSYVVVVSYLIDTTGKVTDIKILEDPGYGAGDDVARAFRKCASWVPATVDGKKVKYRQKQAFTYTVSN